ncbi:MAG: trigger factor [Spirochaetaceae bacterium]|nr:trigger factor [Spirochaetaceae bacterium]
MKVTKKIEKLENSSVKLTVTIGKADVAASYNEVVAKYAKNIQIPGFRKGKVPVSVLERKYGDALKNDAVSEIVEKALGDIFEEMDKNKSDDRPLPYSQPTIDDIPLLDTTKDLTFAVKYDVFPQVEVKNFDGIEIKVPEVKITDDDLKEELEAIRQRNAMVLDKKDDEAVAKDDIVTVNYCELDDKDAEIAGSQRQDFVFTVGTEQNIYKFDNEIIGMKRGETKDLTKEVDGENKKVRVTVTAVKVRNVPELDDELAQDVSDKYNNLEDMKNDIKKNLETALENKLKEIKSNSLLEQLVEKNPVELPASMVKAELDSRFRMMAQQFQTTTEQLEKMLTSAGQKKEDMLTQWTGDAEKMLKSRIIVESLLKEKDISVTAEEIEAEYEKIAAGAGVSVEEVKKHYEDPRSKEYLEDEAKEQKLYTMLFDQVKVSKGDKKTFADLFKPAN